jgi:hypothetical protein
MGFNPDRVASGIKKLKEAQLQKSQQRMDWWVYYSMCISLARQFYSISIEPLISMYLLKSFCYTSQQLLCSCSGEQ